MKINVHAGHNPAGKIACGAVGLINESIENSFDSLGIRSITVR